ncbi:ionotropic receptor 21a-like [Danaus plexippus]|uniref:ionotropic receptor 21a-like n=1 Tax=Danaus plexippus TaxID=13037 RepID=UPI002AB24069|nr:ionotropic receptor 21a-like [Danaus plexippus]
MVKIFEKSETCIIGKMLLRSCIILSCITLVKGGIEDIRTEGSKGKCIGDIVKKYFERGYSMSVVHMGNDNEIVEILNTKELKTIISRSPQSNMSVMNEHYVIDANSSTYFIKQFEYLVYEKRWNPTTRFLILIKNLNLNDLYNVFDILLKYHVVNTLILNNTADPELYTYNPFENFGCGRRYDRIIDLGKCSKSHTKNLYPIKLITGLRNCTFNVTSTHWPPFTIKRAINSTNVLAGIDEYIFREISQLESFNIDVTFMDNGEKFTTISENMSIDGPLNSLQQGKDMVFGGLVLMEARTDMFQFIYLHLLDQDSLVYLVKKAGRVQAWRNAYLVFQVDVWLTLLFIFLLYFLIFVLFFRPKDKLWVVLKMLSFMFSSGTCIRGSFFKRSIFIAWVWCSYFFCCYYQSTFSSITTHPVMEHQIATVEDLRRYNLRPCVSETILDYIKAALNNTQPYQTDQQCKKLLESIKFVSQSDYEYFTIVNQYKYQYYKFDFYDEYGEQTLYKFEKPIFSSLYCVYFNKGFPYLDKLQMHALRLRENGMINAHISRLFWEFQRHYKFKTKKSKELEVVVPLYLIGFGYFLSTLVFVGEILIKKVRDKNKS